MLTVNAKTLADILKVDVRSIKNLVDQGMPKEKRATFVLAACVPWYVERERESARANRGLNDLDLARQRKTLAEAQEAELRVAKILGSVIDADVHEEVVGQVCDRLMPVLQNIPSNYGIRLEQLGVEAAAAESVLESIATDLTSALRSTADEMDRESESIPDDEVASTPSGDMEAHGRQIA